jgi:chaperone modulatory protein CbpM
MDATEEMLRRARLDAGTLEAWVAEGWILRRDAHGYTELDVARACLIRDLREEIGVNDAGVGVVLDLLDQLHGLRAALRGLAGAVHGLPEPVRQQALAALRQAKQAAPP